MRMPAPIFSIGYGMNRRVALPSSRAATRQDRADHCRSRSRPARARRQARDHRVHGYAAARRGSWFGAETAAGAGGHDDRATEHAAPAAAGFTRRPRSVRRPGPGHKHEPGVLLSGVHYLRKLVADLPNPRPAWYFDVTEQGEGLADTGVHLVDRVHETLFPEQPLDWQREIEILAATRWPTLVSLAQFHHLTGESGWPDDLASCVRRDMLEYFCNGHVDYRVRGIHVRLDVRWDWQAEQGDDTHLALYRGTRSRLAVRQGAVERFRPELYVLPDEDISAALERRIAALQPAIPGLASKLGIGMA